MKTLAVIANCTKPRANEVLARLSAKAGLLGLHLYAEGETADRLKSATRIGAKKMIETADAVVALGGDGTVLRAARDLNGLDKPILGVNIGGLGFLTSVAEQELERALECLAADRYGTSTRSIAECVVNGTVALRYRALNDVVMTSSGSARVVTLGLSVDKEHVGFFICDGIILSTPTGSTGHSLSAGGPIVLPESQVFVVSPICAHTLSVRPLVVPGKSVLTVSIAGCSGGLLLSVDGQVGNTLVMGDSVEVSQSSRGVRFVHLPGHSYFSVLRQKLHWRGSNV